MPNTFLNLKQKIKHVIACNGYALKRRELLFYYLERNRAPSINQKTQGKYIELIGPTGVGKTTLLRSLKRETRESWFSFEEIEQRESAQADKLTPFQNHSSLLSKALSSILEQKMSDFCKAKSLNWYSKIILVDLLASDPSLPKGVMLDEGLCHNFSGQLLSLPDKEFVEIMRTRALVYVSAKDEMTVVRQVRKRTSDGGHTIPFHNGLDDKALCEMTRSFMRNYVEPLVARAQKHGIMVCTLFIEDGLQANAERMEEFVHVVASSSALKD